MVGCPEPHKMDARRVSVEKFVFDDRARPGGLMWVPNRFEDLSVGT